MKVAATPPLDLRWQHFQRWYVLGKGRLTPHGQLWICECQAGCFPKGQAEVQATALLDGRAQSCGCDYVTASGRTPRGRPYKDFTGQVIGSWLVVRQAPSRPTGGVVWHCRCVCGTEREKITHALRDTQRLRCDRCRGAAQTHVQVGRIYHNRLVLQRVYTPQRHEAMVLCECLLCHTQATVSSHEIMTRGSGCRCGSKRAVRAVAPLRGPQGGAQGSPDLLQDELASSRQERFQWMLQFLQTHTTPTPPGTLEDFGV